jgi:hypothetical protein
VLGGIGTKLCMQEPLAAKAVILGWNMQRIAKHGYFELEAPRISLLWVRVVYIYAIPFQVT